MKNKKNPSTTFEVETFLPQLLDAPSTNPDPLFPHSPAPLFPAPCSLSPPPNLWIHPSSADDELTNIKLDLDLPDTPKLNITKQIKDSFEILIIISITNKKDEGIKQTFSVNTNDYCALDTQIAQAVIQQLNQRTSTVNPSTWLCPSGKVLKKQEIKILQLIADGQSNTKIGESLNLSVHTVKGYLKNIMQKMSAKNRAELAAISVRSGLA